jgi:membrane-bound lytic murein transglycosylase F
MSLDDIFLQVGQEFGLDWRLLAQIAWQESRLNPKAVGRAGDMGLMQILPTTWNEWAPKVKVTDPYDALSNARVAGAYLSWIRLQVAAAGRPEIYWSLTAYNWGIGNVLRLLQARGGWGQVPPERQDYAIDITLATEVRMLADPS